MGPTTSDLKLVTAYQGEKFGTQADVINNSVPQNLTGYWMKKGSYSNVKPARYAVDGINGNVAVVFRLAELYLMKAEAWNEYLESPDYEHVYAPLNVIRERAGIPDVETSWINYSNAPDKIKTKEGMREIIILAAGTGTKMFPYDMVGSNTMRPVAGIPIMGHLGLTPQSIHKFGTYAIRAKEPDEAEKLVRDAHLLEKAGCFALVLEKVPAALAARVAKEIAIPVIGIGAGGGVDGQVLVIHDMLGINQEFSPRFLRRYHNLFAEMTGAVGNYIADVKSGDFPNEREQY